MRVFVVSLCFFMMKNLFQSEGFLGGAVAVFTATFLGGTALGWLSFTASGLVADLLIALCLLMLAFAAVSLVAIALALLTALFEARAD
jgi:hypothetical protein